MADRYEVEEAELNIENSGLEENSFASSLKDRLQKITFVNARRGWNSAALARVCKLKWNVLTLSSSLWHDGAFRDGLSYWWKKSFPLAAPFKGRTQNVCNIKDGLLARSHLAELKSRTHDFCVANIILFFCSCICNLFQNRNALRKMYILVLSQVKIWTSGLPRRKNRYYWAVCIYASVCFFPLLFTSFGVRRANRLSTRRKAS